MKIKSKIASLLMAVSVIIGSVPTVPSVYAVETASANAPTNVTNIVDYALENNMLRYDASLSDSSDPYHLQGLCVDDELKYMYLSADQIVKVDMETGGVVGTLDGFSTVSGIAAMNGMHLGSLEYHDGWIYTAVIAGNPHGKLMILAIEASKIDRIGMHVNDIEGSVRAVLMKDHMDDYCDPVDEKIFTGWKGPGNFTMSDREGHRFGCGGADGITIGTYPGDKSGKQYVIASYGIYANDENTIRQDNEYTILKFYALDDIWDSNGNPTSHNIVFKKDDNTVADYGVAEALTAEKTLFLYTGNIDWGPQNIAYEPETGDIVLYCYGPTDFKEDFNNVPRIMFVVDGSKAPEEKVLELGQNNTLTNETDKATVKKIADAYSTDTNSNGVIDDNERLRGPVGTLKCICGDPSKHTAETAGDSTWGDTGVKKSEYPICGTLIFNNWEARADEGISYIGKGSDGAGYFYTRGGITQTEVNLWKRTIDSNTGEYKYEYAAPYGEAKEILHYSMDASDIVTENGIKYMKNTLSDKYHAIVEGTTSGIGVDGNAGGAMNFNAYNYPASVDQMSLSDETIRYIDTRIHNSEYSYSFWAKMATGDNTDGNFVPFIGFYRNDGTYAGVFEQRWRGEVKYVVNGVGSASAGDPGDGGVSIGKRDNGWHFYTVTEKAGVGTVYCDGTQKGSYNVSGDHLYRKHICEFIIGGGMSKIWYDKNNRGRLIGSVDDLTIYSGALTADEVKQAYSKTAKTDNSTVTSASADVSAVSSDKLRANYDITADAGKDLTIDTGIAVTSVEGLTKDTDFTVSGNSITLKNNWLSNRQCGINTLVLNGGTNLELTITDVNTPVLNYSFTSGNVTGNTVKDSSVYGKDAVATAEEFTTDHTGKTNAALMFNGYNYSKPEYVKLSDESAAWLNSVIKNGYTMNFWAYGTAENGSVMSMAGLYAADARPLGVVESYEPSDNGSDNSLDEKITVHLDAAKLGGNKTNAANSIEAVTPEKIGLGGWNMYTASYDKASGKIKLYVDGQLKAENSVNDDIIGNISQLFVGHQYKKYYNASGYYDWLTRGGFKGAIDGISVYNSALSDDRIAALYNSEELDYGLAFFEDDFEGYNGSLDGTYTLGGSDKGGKIELGTEGDNHVLNVTKHNNANNVQVSASFDKTYTEGAVYLKYSVKPYSGSSVMFWLVNSAGKQIRLPLFTNDNKVKVTGEGVTEAELGRFTAGEWYDVSAKVDLEAKLIDITVKNRNSGTILSKTGIATSIGDISSMRIQTWSADGTSSFDNIVLKSGRSEAVNDNYDNDYIINDNFENGLSADYKQIGSSASKLEIGTDGTNKVLNIVNNDNNVQAKRAFGKEYTSGTIYVDCKVKPASGASTMFWLNDEMRVPFFGSDGAIKILDKQSPQQKAERKIGTWENGYWYEVSMKIDLDAGKYDVSIKKSGEASYAAQLTDDYTNITAIGSIKMQMYGKSGGAFSSFDDIVVRHENTSSKEKLLFKDTFEYYNNNNLDTGSGKDYVIDGNGGTFGIVEENGNHSGFINRSGGDNIQMKKYFNNAYSSGIISLNYSVKPAAGVSTMLRMVNKNNNKAVLLPFFSNDGKVRIAGNGDKDIGTYTGGKWYDISSKINLNTKTADIVITQRDTGSVIKYSNYPIGNDNVYELRMQVYGGNGPSYYDDIVVTYKAEEANLPYYNDFESGDLGEMKPSNANDECKIVDSNDGHGKVYQINGATASPSLDYNLGGITTGKIKIEADIKTGEETLSTLLQLNGSTNLVLFGNKNSHDGIWFGWDSAKYADTRLTNAWYHVKVTLNLDTGLMDSFITDPNGKVYSLTKHKYAEPKTKLDTVGFRTWDTGKSYVDNISFTIPESVGSEITARSINASGAVITDFETLKNANNPILNVNYYNASNRDKSVWVYVNTYKENRLVKCKRELIVIGATEKEGTKSVDISDVSFEGADSMNVLIWDDVMCPMFNALNIK